MTITFVNKNQSGGSAATQTIPLTVNPADVLVLMVHFNAGAGPLPTLTVTDSAGNTWTRAGFSQDNGTTGGKYLRSEMWTAVNNSFTGSDTVTLAFSTSLGVGNATYTVANFTGVDNSFPILDACTFTADYSGTASNPHNTQTVSLANAMTVAMAGYSGPSAFSTPTNYTVMGGNVSSTPSTMGPYYRLETAAGTDNWTTQTDSYAYWAAGSLTLRPAGVFKTGLDGSASANSSSPTTASLSATLTTTKNNDVIVAIIQMSSNKTVAAPAVSSISGTNGLTWTRRSTNTIVPTDATNSRYTTEVWYAVAATPLSAKTINANLSAGCDCSLTVFGVSGANTSVIWEPHTSLPKVGQNINGSFATMNSGAFSTTNPDDFVFATGTNNGSAVAATSGIAAVAATMIASGTTAASAFTFIWETEYINAPNPLSSVSASFGGGTAQDWHVIVDAITAGPASVTNATGTITTALTKPSQSVVANESFSGSIHTNLSKAQFAAAGFSGYKGTITTNLSRPTMAALGFMAVRGTINTALQGISQRATAPLNATGQITTRLSGFRFAATDIEEFIGTINTALRGFNVAQGGIVAREIFTGTITTNLSGFVQQAGSAEERFIGTIHTRLGRANALVTTDVQGLLIILGDIYTNLYPVDLTLLGAKIGAPGQGPWYSYRYLDSGGP